MNAKPCIVGPLTLLLIAGIWATTAHLHAQPLPNVGKPMPPLKVAEWISPDKVASEDLTHRPYVIEFWATWCGPCRQTVPHLNALSKKLKPRGLILIGISRDRPNQVAKVKAFYTEFNMNYLVAIDAGMGAQLRMSGIPHAFVVDEAGVIVWEGHPMSPEFETVVRRVLDEWVVRLDEFPALRDLAASILREGGKARVAALLKLTNDPQRGAEAKKLLEAVRKLARLQLTRVLERAEEMPTEAADQLDAIARQYEGTDAAAEAAAKARKIRDDPGFADEVAVARAVKDVRTRHQKLLKEKLAPATDRIAAMRLALPIFRKAENELRALAHKYPNAKTTKVVLREAMEIATIIQAVERALAQQATPPAP